MLLATAGIWGNSWRISDDMATQVPKNVFWKKTWRNYEASIVLIWPSSSWIGTDLSFLWEVYEKHLCKENENFLKQHCSLSKLHTCAQYGHISTNYAMSVTITLVIWLESQASLFMIAYFVNKITYRSTWKRNRCRNFGL